MVGSGTAVQVGILVSTVAGLWTGTRLLVDSVIRLARRFGLSELTIGLTIVAGVVAMLVMPGILRPADAYEAVDWDVISLIAGVVPLGIAFFSGL